MDTLALKELWNEGKTAISALLTIPSPWIAEVYSRSGMEVVILDLQHGFIAYDSALSMLQAMSGGGVIPMVRMNWNDPSMMQRMLDAGAMGVICPMVNSASEASAFVDACHYPPLGSRSFGPLRAGLVHKDYFQNAQNLVMTFAMIETGTAMDQLEEIVSTPGLTGIYVGPSDLSISMNRPRMADFRDPVLLDALNKILTACKERRLITAIHVPDPVDTRLLVEMGFDMVTPVTDHPLLTKGLTETLSAVRKML